MHILLMVVKATSCLDFAAPLLWDIRRRAPSARMTVLYCTSDRRSILKDATYYSKLFRELNVAETDYSDYARLPWKLVEAAVQRGRRITNESSSGASLMSHAHARQIAAILPGLRPTKVLFDHRSAAAFEGSEHIYEYLETARPPVFLLPHAPHHTGTNAFVPYHGNPHDPLPDYCEYWLPFRYDRVWESLPERRPAFHYVGYPGLDSAWLNYIAPRAGATNRSGTIRCVFIIRKFFARGVRRPHDHDPLALEFEEFKRHLDLLALAVRPFADTVEVVVKPHPANDLAALRDLMSESGIRRWSISAESAYDTVGTTDIVVSMYSTTPLIYAMAGVPVVLVHSSAQDAIHGSPEMERMYTGLSHYISDPARLPDEFRAVYEGLSERTAGSAEHDGPHLREFFPDGALDRAAARLGVGTPRQQRQVP